MLAPKKVRYRKHHRGKMRGIAQRGNALAFGEYGLQSTELGWVTAREIEAARIALTRHARRGGQIWIRVFPPQAGEQEAGRNPYGQRQGRPGVLGGGGQARPHDI